MTTTLLFLGCASPTYDFKGDWTPDEKAAVMDGIAEWGAGGTTHVELIRVTDANPDPEGCSESADLEPSMLGITYRPQGQICFWVDRVTRSARLHGIDRSAVLQQAAAHETGHWLGLAHTDPKAPASVMRAELSEAALDVQPYDLQLLEEHEGK